MSNQTQTRSDSRTSTTSPIVQLCIGASAALINIGVLCILASNRKLFKKSVFTFGLATGNLSLTFAFTVASIYRMVLAIWNLGPTSADASYCLKTMVPELYYIAFTMPGFILFTIGIERLVAVCWAQWYYTRWRPEKNWYVLGAIYVVVFVSASLASVSSLFFSSSLTKDCTWYAVAGTGLAAYFYMISIFCGLCAVISIFISFFIGRNHYKKIPNAVSSTAIKRRERKQLQLTTTMLTVAFLDLGLVVVPNILLLLQIVFKVNGLSVGSVSLYTFHINAIVNMLAHVLFNSEFRKATFRFLRLDRLKCLKNQVASTTAWAGPATGNRSVPLQAAGNVQNGISVT